MELQASPEAAPARSSTLSLLIVDDEAATRDLCRDVALDAGLQVHTSATTENALEILDQFPVDIVVTDLKVPQLGGIELLKRIRQQYPQMIVMVLTQYGTIETAVEATRLGATDYVTKPFHVEEFRTKLERVAHGIELDQENRILREQLRSRPGFGGLTGVSPKMQRVYQLIEKVAQHNYPVLILGESGTGKELVARSIHFSGPRRNKPFVPVDCSALVPTLIESELFGYVKGAFTGAQHSKQGLFEAAGEGTLFLDEIGDLPVDLQAKLLRALQEREIKPVGSNERVGVRARMIAATNRDLETAIRSGSFRQDLYFRLNVVQIKLPPLRERRSDLPLLANTFLEKFGDPQRQVRTISEDAMRRLVAYDWPGTSANWRMRSNGRWPWARGRSFTWAISHPICKTRSPNACPSRTNWFRSRNIERRAIFRALRETAGDKLAAARLLGIGKTTLYRKLKQYDVAPPQPAQSD